MSSIKSQAIGQLIEQHGSGAASPAMLTLQDYPLPTGDILAAPLRLLKLVHVAALAVLCLSTATAHAASASVEDERLLATARLWRDVKLYHLAVARGQVDWDAALVASLPAIRAA